MCKYLIIGETELHQNNVTDLLEAERIFENSKLKQYVCKKIAECVNVKNYLFYFELSKTFYLKDLLDFLFNMLFQCYLTKSNNKVFYDLKYEDFLTLVSWSELKIDSELEIFNAIVDWINHKESERKVHFDELFKRVRLPLLTEEIILNVIQTHPLFSNSFNCKSFILKALKIKRNKHKFPSSVLLQNRCYFRQIDHKEIVFILGKKLKKSTEHLKPRAVAYKIDGSSLKKIRESPPMCEQTRPRRAVVVGRKIYCIGSTNHYIRGNKSFEVYSNGKWTKLTKVPTHQSGFCMCAFMGKIRVFRGHFAADSFAYDPQQDEWERTAEMVFKLRDSSCAVFNGKCAVVGGYDHVGRNSNRVEVYDHHLNKWSLLHARMLIGRIAPGLLTVGNKLYVVGGRVGRQRENLDSHEVYDALSGRFCFIAPTSIRSFPFRGIRLIVSGSKIFVHKMKAVTGADEVKVYDVAMNEWQTAKAMKMEGREDDFVYSAVVLQKCLEN